MSSITEQAFIDSRRRLIEAATEAFKEEGYRASVERIAAKAGVAKQTLYNHFAGKDDLFAEMVRQASGAILVALDGDEADIRESLLRFSSVFRDRVLGDCLAHYRTLIAEAPRFPELAKSFYDNGPAQTTGRLAAFLGRAMAKGALRADHPVFAAEMLLGMLTGIERTHRLCGAPALPPDAEARRVAQIIDCFLVAYAPERKIP